MELNKCGKVAGLGLDEVATMLHGAAEGRTDRLDSWRGACWKLKRPSAFCCMF